MRKSIFFTAIILCYAVTAALAQSNATDSSIYQQSFQNAVALYYKSIGENAHIYNGSEYVAYSAAVNNKNPFFEVASLQNGDIKYDGIVYNNVPLNYDIYKEEVVINRYNQNFRIRLAANKIDWFTIDNHLFIKIVADSSTKVLGATGFFDKVYDGSIAVLVKRRKKLDETVTSTGINSQYTEDDRFFIKKDGIYHPVNSKKSVMHVFGDKKKDVQKLMRKNKIKFKPSLEFGIVKAAQFYDQVKN